MTKLRKSSFSGGSSQGCVEIAHLPGAIAIRDSKDPDGPMLVIKLAGHSGEISSTVGK